MMIKAAMIVTLAALSWLLVAVLALGVLALLSGDAVRMHPPATAPVRHSLPRPTSSTAPVHPAVDKTGLIIQQNVNCWYPIPGYICTGRQYQ